MNWNIFKTSLLMGLGAALTYTISQISALNLGAYGPLVAGVLGALAHWIAAQLQPVAISAAKKLIYK